MTQYLHSGDNTVKLQVTDSVGSVGTKTWTINVVEFYLESSFDDTLVYSGEVTFRYTPYGNISKTINFTIDGKTLGSTTTAVTGRQLTYAIPAQIHGAHLVEVSMTAEINGKQVTSNKIVKDIMWTTEGDTTPIISCATKTASAKQYSNVAINYTVYDPSSSTTTVTLEVDGAKTATLTVGRTMQTWTWKSADIGTHTLKIVCGSVSKEISVEIKELGITIEPVKTNLAFDFNPAGKTNADETRLWTDGNNRDSVARSLTLDYGCSGRHLFCGHRWIEQLYSVGNAHVEAGSCRCVICDWYGTCCGYPAESNAWFAYLGLLFPAIQSAWSNLSAIYCVMVLPCFVVHLCR